MQQFVTGMFSLGWVLLSCSFQLEFGGTLVGFGQIAGSYPAEAEGPACLFCSHGCSSKMVLLVTLSEAHLHRQVASR